MTASLLRHLLFIQVFRVRHKRTGDLFAIKKCTRKFAQRLIGKGILKATLPGDNYIVIEMAAWLRSQQHLVSC